MVRRLVASYRCGNGCRESWQGALDSAPDPSPVCQATRTPQYAPPAYSPWFSWPAWPYRLSPTGHGGTKGGAVGRKGTSPVPESGVCVLPANPVPFLTSLGSPSDIQVSVSMSVK